MKVNINKFKNSCLQEQVSSKKRRKTYQQQEKNKDLVLLHIEKFHIVSLF